MNCKPPWKPLPVLMAQLPPDSHCARRSQSESGAAWAAGLKIAEAVPTATVDAANFANLDAVLRACRAMSVLVLSFAAKTRHTGLKLVVGFTLALLYTFLVVGVLRGTPRNGPITQAHFTFQFRCPRQ